MARAVSGISVAAWWFPDDRDVRGILGTAAAAREVLGSKPRFGSGSYCGFAAPQGCLAWDSAHGSFVRPLAEPLGLRPPTPLGVGASASVSVPGQKGVSPLQVGTFSGL